MKEKQLLIQNNNRLIPATLLLPETAQKVPLVVMNHGFGGHRNEGGGFTRIAEILAENGIATVRLDFAGCGESTASYREFCLSNNIADSNTVRDYVISTENIDQNKLGIFGYSFGGRASLLITEKEHPYQAMVLLAPHVSIMDRSKEIDLTANGFHEINWFGTPLQVSRQNYEEEVASNQDLLNAKHQLPTLLISGTEDQAVPYSICQAFAKQISAQFMTLEHCDHGYGFYGGNVYYTESVANAAVEFFTEQFK